MILLNDINPKEYLLQLQRLNTNINQKITELDDLRRMTTCIKSPAFDSDKVQSSGSGDAAFVRQIEKIVLLQDEINKEIDRFADEKHIGRTSPMLAPPSAAHPSSPFWTTRFAHPVCPLMVKTRMARLVSTPLRVLRRLPVIPPSCLTTSTIPRRVDFR